MLDMVFSGNASAMWKWIEYGLKILHKGVIWWFGNGQSVRTWRDPWIPRGPSCRTITTKGNRRLNYVSDFLDEHGAWRSQLLAQYFWPMDIMEILKIGTSPRQRDDFIARQLEKTCLFTIHNAYRLAMYDHAEQFGEGVLLACTGMVQYGNGALFGKPKFHEG